MFYHTQERSSNYIVNLQHKPGCTVIHFISNRWWPCFSLSSSLYPYSDMLLSNWTQIVHTDNEIEISLKEYQLSVSLESSEDSSNTSQTWSCLQVFQKSRFGSKHGLVTNPNGHFFFFLLYGSVVATVRLQSSKDGYWCWHSKQLQVDGVIILLSHEQTSSALGHWTSHLPQPRLKKFYPEINPRREQKKAMTILHSDSNPLAMFYYYLAFTWPM